MNGVLERLLDGNDLSAESAGEVMRALTDEALPPAVGGALLRGSECVAIPGTGAWVGPAVSVISCVSLLADPRGARAWGGASSCPGGAGAAVAEAGRLIATAP